MKSIKETKCYEYAVMVRDGKVLSCRFIQLAVDRFFSDLKRKDIYFDLVECQKVEDFWAEILYVPELKKPVPIQPPHAFWIEQLLCWKIYANNFRRFQSVYAEMARKNLKTFEAAGITWYESLLGRDEFPEIMHGANTREQAMICTTKTGRIARASPEIAVMIDKEITLHTYMKDVKKITYMTEDRECSITAMPKDPGDGGNASVLVVDELQEAKTLDLLETGESGQGQRNEPLTLVITSPGHDKSAPCYSVLRKKSVDILEGTIEEDTHLAVMFELDSEEEKEDVKMWAKSNPMIDYIPSIRPFLEKRKRKADHEGGSTAANIYIKNAGIWIDAPVVWIPSATIKRNNHGITIEDLKGLDAYSGIDLAGALDLNAEVKFFPNVREEELTITTIDEDGKKTEIKKVLPIHAVKATAWIPEQKIIDQRKDGVDYRKFVEGGWMKLFEGQGVEYDKIADYLIHEFSEYNVRVMGCDPKNKNIGIVPFVHAAGLYEASGDYAGLTDVFQGFNLTSAVAVIEEWAANGQLDFMGNPVTAMCFANTTLHVKDMAADEGGLSGHRFPSKGKSNGRIDIVSAFCDAVFEWQRLAVEPEQQDYGFEIWN